MRSSRYRAVLLFVMMLFMASMLSLNDVDAARRKDKTRKKKKKVIPKQVKLPGPWTEEDARHKKNVNLWMYYQTDMEKHFGDNHLRDKNYLKKASGMLKTISEYFGGPTDILEQGQELYEKFYTKISRRPLSDAASSRIRDELVRYRRELAAQIKDFRTGGFFGD